MIHLLYNWFKKSPASVDPEIEMIVQELDEWLAREHELLEDGVGEKTNSISSLLRNFAQRCQKVALVGSWRRGKVNPGDVDIMYVPKSDLQVIEFLEQVADNESQIINVNNAWRCTVGGVQIDFIKSSLVGWGMDMIHFTGSREFNKRVLRHIYRRGYETVNEQPVTHHRNSYNSYYVNVFDNWSEEKILKHLGLEAYLDPHTRSEATNE
jgi:DNA polymerase/3'-5' exonuclease PolX